MIQLTITLFAAAVCWVGADLKAAYSAVIGGGISIIATLYFAKQVLVGIGTPAATIARRFFVGEAVKLVLTAALFAIAILWLEVSFLPLFLTYMATLLAYWLVLPFASSTRTP